MASDSIIPAGDYNIVPTYDRTEAGWYCEVLKKDSGATVFTTGSYEGKPQAVHEAREWVKTQS
jgi:hypothetical protein